MSRSVLHDPTAELAPTSRPRLTPPKSLDGKRVALFDIGKTRSDEFLDHVEAHFRDRGLETLRVAKPTNATPAPRTVIAKIIEEADVVVVALAD